MSVECTFIHKNGKSGQEKVHAELHIELVSYDLHVCWIDENKKI